MILTQAELQKLKKKTPYDGVFVYVAPDNYHFWSNSTDYGETVWGGDCLENHYYLKKIEDGTIHKEL